MLNRYPKYSIIISIPNKNKAILNNNIFFIIWLSIRVVCLFVFFSICYFYWFTIINVNNNNNNNVIDNSTWYHDNWIIFVMDNKSNIFLNYDTQFNNKNQYYVILLYTRNKSLMFKINHNNEIENKQCQIKNIYIFGTIFQR